MTSSADFAARLHWWRERRGLSQLELAGRADISQRHLSFLELGRASPSRQMVLRLAEALDMPLRQHNALLLAAGFAPTWRESGLDAPELAQVANAVDHMLAQQEPFPAVAVDRHWHLLKANGGAVRLVEFLVGPLPPGTPINLADALVAPDVLRPYLVNWAEVVRYFIRSVEADAAADGSDETGALLTGCWPTRACGGPEGSAVGSRQRPGAADALSQGQDGAVAVHDHCHARHAAGRHGPGAARRELLPDGRRDRQGFARLGCEAERACAGQLTATGCTTRVPEA